MRKLTVIAALAAILTGAAAPALAHSHHHWRHAWSRHRASPAHNSWGLHHGDNPMGSAANGQ